MMINNDFSHRLAGIKARFIRNLDDVYEDMGRIEGRLLHADTRDEAVSKLCYHAHKLRGVAPILGLARLGEVASAAEELISNGYVPPAPDASGDVILPILAELKAEIGHHIAIDPASALH